MEEDDAHLTFLTIKKALSTVVCENPDKYSIRWLKTILVETDIGWLRWLLQTQFKFSITPVFSRHVLLVGASASHVFKK